MELTQLRVHDLLRLPSPDAVSVVDPPSWLGAALQAAPWAVVRRAPPLAGRVAVGLRGTSRDERIAGFLAPEAILQKVSPEDLVASETWKRAPRPDHPVVLTLARFAPAFSETGLVCGIAGGAGFELATGALALNPSSDLDLIIRVAGRLPEAALQSFADIAARADSRIDVLVETPIGGFSLAEFAGDSTSLLLRSSAGPRLIERTALADLAIAS